MADEFAAALARQDLEYQERMRALNAQQAAVDKFARERTTPSDYKEDAEFNAK